MQLAFRQKTNMYTVISSDIDFNNMKLQKAIYARTFIFAFCVETVVKW